MQDLSGLQQEFNRNSTGMNQLVDLSPMWGNTSIRSSFQQSWCGHMWQLHWIDAFIEGVRNWRAMAVWMAQLAGTHHLGLASVFRKNLHLLAYSHCLPTKLSLVTHTTPDTFCANHALASAALGCGIGVHYVRLRCSIECCCADPVHDLLHSQYGVLRRTC
jgi:hypothetical protein